MDPAEKVPWYSADNCKFAYQLNWSLTVFARQPILTDKACIEELQTATEQDGVRILDWRIASRRAYQFWLSTVPACDPSEAVRSVKGRWQYLLRSEYPRAFYRNYWITSVGDVREEIEDAYVAKQNLRHPMADSRVQKLLRDAQIHDPEVDLSAKRCSGNGQFMHNLHLVLENTQRLIDVRPEHISKLKQGLIRICRKKGYLLSRAGIVGNHLHILVGCHVTDAPLSVALSLMNNLAWLTDKVPIFDYGAYLGTFGNYDRWAMRLSKLRDG